MASAQTSGFLTVFMVRTGLTSSEVCGPEGVRDDGDARDHRPSASDQGHSARPTYLEAIMVIAGEAEVGRYSNKSRKLPRSQH